MAKKQKEKNKKKEKKGRPTPAPDDFGHEIWGLIFLATGVLILISLIAHLASPESNLLGRYFGTALSSGLIYFLGPICVFFFPGAVGFIGWQRFRGELISFRILFYGILITLEICALLSIHYLPELVTLPTLKITSNRIGLFFVELLKPIFGKYTFGPYFIFSIALVVSTLSAFRIPPQQIIALIRKGFSLVRDIVTEKWASWQEQRAQLRVEQELRTEEKKLQKEAAKEEQRKSQQQTDVTPVSPRDTKKEIPKEFPVGDPPLPENPLKDISRVEAEAKQRLEEELAAFRAKRGNPIQIMSIETEDIETEEEADLDIFPADIIDSESPKHNFPTTSARKTVSSKPYKIPEASVLPDPPALASMIDKESIEENSMTLEKTLMNFGVEGKVVFVSPGPVVTRYEIELAPGIKVSKVVNLHDDISMAVGGQRIRIEAPIPGKSAVGIELPNNERQIVHFKHILQSDAFKKTKAKLPVIIGTNVSGAAYVTDVTKMPHVLIAGQTGSGKSVCINSLICSLLMTKKPEELRIIMIDPKKVELAFYERIPHLMSPVVTESKEAVKALQWGVIEMERRYRMLAKIGARNIDSFNSRVDSEKFKDVLPEEDNKKLPFIVIIVDELADLMMTASKDVEGLIQRIAQLARAVGIHLIVATQRPSVDIITGPIKANLTSRIGFRTIQSTDSRTILGHIGAEKLLGLGDMLFLRNGAPEIERFHGAYISEEDVEKIVTEIRSQNIEIEKIDSFCDATDTGAAGSDSFVSGNNDRDELFEDAMRTIVSIGQGSTSLLQRRMKIGYARAGRLMDELELAGVVGPPDGSKAREVLVTPDQVDELLAQFK